MVDIQPKGKPRKIKKQVKGEGHLSGARGHKSIDCWDNEKSKDKHPSNYKKKKPDNPSSPHSNQKKKLKCDYCNNECHTEQHCYRKKNKERKQNKEHHLVCIAIDGDYAKKCAQSREGET
jgi:hypothetical protein